jgi:hypothetical protein
MSGGDNTSKLPGFASGTLTIPEIMCLILELCNKWMLVVLDDLDSLDVN